MDMLWIALSGVGGLAVGAVVSGVVAFKKGIENRRRTAEALIGSAEQESERIIKEAKLTAEAKKKETLLEAKDEVHRLRNEADREIKDRRREIQRQENRLQQK